MDIPRLKITAFETNKYFSLLNICFIFTISQIRTDKKLIWKISGLPLAYNRYTAGVRFERTKSFLLNMLKIFGLDQLTQPAFL